MICGIDPLIATVERRIPRATAAGMRKVYVCELGFEDLHVPLLMDALHCESKYHRSVRKHKSAKTAGVELENYAYSAQGIVGPRGREHLST